MEVIRVLIIVFILVMIALLIESAHIWLTSSYGFYPVKEYMEKVPENGQEIYLPSGAHGIHYIVNPAAKTVLYYHGNAGNISLWNNMINLITSIGINIFIIDYRGFGPKAKGYATISSFVRDAFEAYYYLVSKISFKNIILWGESMGGYAALKIAQKEPIGYLALAATFTSSVDMVEYLGLPFYYNFIAKREPLNNLRMISNIKIPTVVLHSVEDDVIPYRCGEQLYDRCSAKDKLFISINGSHAAPKITREHLSWLLDFCGIEGNTHSIDPLLEKICSDTQKACPFKLPKHSEFKSSNAP
jgi:esterase/lipase